MTAFIAATAKGDIATGSIAYKTIFAVGTTPFVITLIPNMRVDPIRPQVQADLDRAPTPK